MGYIRDKLFIIWLLLLVFGHQFTGYTGMPSPDKLIAPLLIVMGFFTLFQSSGARLRRVISMMFLVLFLLLIKNISFFGSNEVYFSLMKFDVVKFGHFFVPLLCITNMKMFRQTGWVIVLIAIIGCISPFLVSIGLITLPIGWFEASRIGGLLKTKGFFLSSGDLAQYIVFAIAWVVLVPGVINKKIKSLRIMRWALFISVVLGLLSTQSRNVFVSLFVGLFILWWLRESKVLASGQKIILIFGFVITSMILVSFVTIFSTESYDTFVGAGGEFAKRTAETRLDQYAFAWDIITTHPFLGADMETYAKEGGLINGIHNIWLRLLAHGGLMTVIILLVILIRVFVNIRRVAHIPEKSDEAMVVTAYFASMMIALMFYVGLGDMYWALFGVAAALICIEPFTVATNTNNNKKMPSPSLIHVRQKTSRVGVKPRL